MSSANTTISLTAHKALRTLEVVAAAAQPVSLSDVAEQIGTDKSTAYRMLTTLVDAGYVLRDAKTKHYRLSYKVVSLSRNLLAENEVFRLSREVLNQLTAITQETTHLCILDGYEAVLVQKVKGSQLVAVDFQVGDRSPLHCTSIGKVLLAFQDVRFTEAVIAAGLPQYAVNTITDPDALRRELTAIRAQGYAIDDHEFADNMRCIAVAVFERDYRVQLGISMSGPDSRFTCDKLDALKQPLLEASRNLSRLLGGLPGT